MEKLESPLIVALGNSVTKIRKIPSLLTFHEKSTVSPSSTYDGMKKANNRNYTILWSGGYT